MRARIAQGADATAAGGPRRVADPEVQTRRDTARARERQRAAAKREWERGYAATRAKRTKQADALVAEAIKRGLRAEAGGFLWWLLERGSRWWLGEEDRARETVAGVSSEVLATREALQRLIHRAEVSARRERLAKQILAGRDALGLVQDEAFGNALDDFLLWQPKTRRGPRARSALRATTGVLDAALAQGGVPACAARRTLTYRMAQLATGEGTLRGRAAAKYVENQTKRPDVPLHAKRLRRAEIAYQHEVESALEALIARAEAGDEAAGALIDTLGQRIEATDRVAGIPRRNTRRKESTRTQAR